MSVILIADDDAVLCRNIAVALKASGYETREAHSVYEAVSAAAGADLILLDVMLPDGTGYDCCEQIRQITGVPVLFLTSCSEEQEIVRGLDAGADDYITKPFRLMEQLSRIRANLRRTVPRETPEIPELTATEQKLLEVFLANKEHYVTREQLLAALWDAKGCFVNDNTLSVHISRLRDKLRAAGYGQIRTKRGMGYLWTGQTD